MPPEPLPWDRKDLLRDRKHERSESVGSLSRWREASHHGPPSREFGRWGSSEFRTRPPGHSKQGVWHVHSEESDHVLTPSRCNEKIVDCENSRPSGHNRGDGRHNRSSSSSRENNRGSFSQKEYNNSNSNKGHSWEADVSPNGPSRSNGMTDQRSVDNMIMENSHPHSDDFVSSWDQFNLKEQQQQDNKTGGGSANGLGTGRKVDKESSLGSTEWKLSHKWSRSGSLSSRGSSFSQSGSSKSMGVDSSEAKNEVQIKALTPLQSPSGETGACVTSAALFEDPNCRKKKPRLGWGEGLAKYEKKKVEGPDDSIVAAKPGLFVCTTDPLDPHMDQSEKSPVIPFAIDPATPSSVGCSSSSGREDKPFTVTSNIENETSNFCSPADVTMENYLERIPFNLENLDLASISNLSISLGELLQDESTSPTDSSFVRCTAINKLLVLKRDVSKELEITESEIDLLETELKSQSLPAAAAAATASSNDLFDHQETPCEDQLVPFSNLILEATPLNLVPSAQGGEAADMKDGHGVDSPGGITTNYTEKADGEDEDLQALGAQLVSACDVNTLVALNNDIAKNATQEFEIPLPPAGPSNVDPAKETVNSSGVRNDDLTKIRDKIMERKHFLKFQERVVALKYRVFQRMWKEDMQLLSARKNRARSQKRQELCLRAQNGIFQKHRSSTRVRFSSPAGNTSVVPSTEVINFTSKLLSDPQPKVYRNTLKMPPLILDKNERIASRFVSSNGLLEDPRRAEEERALINPWTLEERKIFIDKFAEFGKDFKKISSFLDHKTVAACVEFYYKNHKSDWFAIKKKNKPEFPAQGKSSASSNYLVTSGKQLNHERNASSLHMLGAVSALVANADNNGVEIQHRRPSNQLLLRSKEAAKPRFDDGNEEGPSSPEILDHDRETAAADVLAGICGSMTSCVTSSFTPGENNHHRVLKKSSLTVEVMHSPDDDDDSCSDESCEEEMTNQVDWTDEEKSNFVQAVSCYGKDFSMVSQQVRTKSRDQCRLFFSKARKCLGLKGVRHPTAIPMEEDESKGGQIVSDLNTLPCEESLQAVVPEEENNEKQTVMPEEENGHKKRQRELVEAGNSERQVGSTRDSQEEQQTVMPEEENGHKKRQRELVEAGNSERQVGNTRYSQEELLQSQRGGGVENRNCELNVSMKTDLNCVMDDDLSVIGGVLSHMDRDVVQVDINNKQLQKKLKTDHGLVQLNRDNFPVAAANSVPSHQNTTFNPDLLSNRADPLQVIANTRNDYLAASKNPILLLSSKLNGNLLQSSDKYLMQDCFLQKCTSSSKTLTASVAELPSFLPPKQDNENQGSRKVVACGGGSSSNLEKPPMRNGDIKLFGQILTHPSPKHENEEKRARLNGSLFDLKSTPAAASLNGSLFDLKSTSASSPVVADARPLKGKVIEGKNYMSSENGSVRSSYSFLDGNRIQSGFSSCLPDSAILLAKYPAAFVNLSSSTSNLEQQTMPPPFEPKNDLSSNKGMVDYNHHHLYSRSQQQQVGSSRGEKSQQEILLTEMRMLNGYEAAPSNAQQQQSRMMMMAGGGISGGMNMGRVISDPVAALKMHYGSGVKEQQKNGHIGTPNHHNTREDEPWRGNNGDIGR